MSSGDDFIGLLECFRPYRVLTVLLRLFLVSGRRSQWGLHSSVREVHTIETLGVEYTTSRNEESLSKYLKE